MQDGDLSGPARPRDDERATQAAWLALAFRSALPTAEAQRIARGDGPKPDAFPPDTLAREAEDLEALEALGGRLLTLQDPDYPPALKEREDAPLVLQVAGRADLLHAGGVLVVGGFRGPAGQRLMDALDAGQSAVVVLAKGLLKAKSLLRSLHEPLENGSVAVVSAEPPRAAWGPLRDKSRDRLVEWLTRRTREA